MKTVFAILVFVCSAATFATAQPVITPRNMALGGGGSTYITDYNANFYNPANLMIQDRQGLIDFGVMSAGFFADGVQNYKVVADQYDNLERYFRSYQDGAYDIQGGDRSSILEDNFKRNKSYARHRARYDITYAGLKWKQTDKAFSVALRSRTSSAFEVGRGWYSNTYIEDDDLEILDRTLIHRYQTLHELSFGYAESFKFLTGLTPRLDNFIIGIAPKFVLGGTYLNASWHNVYERTPGSSQSTRFQSFGYTSSGSFANVSSEYRDGATAVQAASSNFNNDFSTISGIGAGLDIGITYLITLGSDLTAVQTGEQPTRKSLRLSFSMTDIGFLSLSDPSFSIDVPNDTTIVASPTPTVSNQVFVGARGQYLEYIDRFGENNPILSSEVDESNFSTLLPMALHGGALLEINRVKIMGDFSVGLTNNAFNSTTLTSSLGIELRPLKFLPLRAGARMQAEQIRFLSVGSAIETKHWDFTVAALLTPESLTNQPALIGLSVASLQFNF